MTTLGLLRALLLGSGFGAIVVCAYAVLSAPVVAPHLLGIRGRERMRALEQSVLFAEFEPLLRGVGMRVRASLGGSALRALDRQLLLAGDFLGLEPEEFLALCGLAAGLGGSLGAAYSFLGEHELGYAVVAAALGALLPYSRLAARQEQRREQIEHGLPPLIDLLVLGLSAGLDLPGAVRQVVQLSSNPSDPWTMELAIVLQELGMGKTRKDVLTQLAERLPFPAVREFTSAVLQAEEHGNPLARVLGIHAESSRRQRSALAEERAAKAGAKLLLPLVLVFVAILLLIIGPVILSASSQF